MNIYEYINENGKWEREVVKSLEKFNTDNSNKSAEALKIQTEINLEYDFYSRFQQREDEWFYLIQKRYELIKEADKLYAEILSSDGFYIEEDEDKEDILKPSKMRLYAILGSVIEETSSEYPEDFSELYNINDRISVLENKLPYLGDFDKKPKYTNNGIGLVNQKKIIKSVVNSEVRSVEDSIADLAKMNSLLFSCISAMYGTMSDSAKGKIDEETKTIIDYSVEKFANTQTRADRQLMKEGTGLVDKLFDRETQIADIIDSVKS